MAVQDHDRALIVACLLPRTHGGLLESSTAEGCPGVIVIGSVIAGAFPASSRAMSTIGSAKV